MFGTLFNQKVDKLPAAITYIHFGRDFNLPVNCLPPNLVNLQFGQNFNQPVLTLPPSLQKLRFGVAFNYPVDYLPKGLRKLCILNSQYAHELENLPAALVKLTLAPNLNYEGRGRIISVSKLRVTLVK